MSVRARSWGLRSTLAERRLVVATDLDGTFLGGTADERAALYGWLRKNRAAVGLIFVTGRAFDSVAPLLEDPALPVPDVVIADVGASVGAGFPLEPIAEIETRLVGSWPGREAVKQLFADLSLEEQSVPQRGRVSFKVTDVSLVQACRARAAIHGFNVVYSRGRYLDVLPSGVDKGRALLTVIDHFGIAPERVLACGDTLNDLSLLETGLCAVAVGGSEPELLEATRARVNVLHAQKLGAAGIVEAISYFFEPFSGDARP